MTIVGLEGNFYLERQLVLWMDGLPLLHPLLLLESTIVWIASVVEVIGIEGQPKEKQRWEMSLCSFSPGANVLERRKLLAQEHPAFLNLRIVNGFQELLW